MATERVEPASLTPAELDAYLARGWYRIGHRLITTDLLLWRGELRSTLWTRLDVQGHRFSPSMRKLLAGNGRRFQAQAGALVIDEEHEQLYARYREGVGGDRADSLVEILGGDRGRALFDTRAITVRDQGRLVAFSWFDVGEQSVQSLTGVWDPAYRKHSLGLYTLLLEILETAALGRRFHYAGYVLGEPSSMDYKLQVGSLQFLDIRTASWLAEPPFAASRSPAEILRVSLDAAQGELARAGVEVTRYLNPALKIHGLLEKAPQCPAQPLLLVCGGAADARVVLVVWEPRREVYGLLRARPVVATLERGGEGEERTREEIRLFAVEARLAEARSAPEVALLTRVHLAMMSRWVIG